MRADEAVVCRHGGSEASLTATFMVDRITQQMAGAARRGPALGGGDAGLPQPHHRVTLPLPVNHPGSTQTQARPKPGEGVS